MTTVETRPVLPLTTLRPRRTTVAPGAGEPVSRVLSAPAAAGLTGTGQGPDGKLAVLACAVGLVIAAAEHATRARVLVLGPAGPLACEIEAAGPVAAAAARLLDDGSAPGADELAVPGAVQVASARVGGTPPPGFAVRFTLTGTTLLAEFDPDLLDCWFAEVLLRSVETALAAFAEPGRLAADLPVAAAADLDAARRAGWAGFTESPPTTLLAPVREAVLAGPDTVAVRYGGETVTYAQLWAAAGRIGHRLRAEGARRGDRIAVLADKSWETIAAMLGILGIGAAYVPLDAQSPAGRLASIVTGAGCRIVVAEPGLAGVGQDLARQLAAAGQPAPRVLGVGQPDAGTAGEDLSADPDDAAYVIYTSGSTGAPKGVLVRHRAIASYVRWKLGFHDLDRTTKLAQLPSLAFDSSVSDVFSVLAAGGELVLVDSATKLDPARTAALVAEHAATHITLVPSLYRVLLPALARVGGSLRVVTVAGETTTHDLVCAHHEALPHTRLVNEFGPTENSIGATAFDHRPDSGPGRPVGGPIGNTVLRVTDRAGRLVPPGFVGEARLSGSGLADGYLGEPGLTAQAFVDDPDTPSGRSYLTGDLVWWRPDGTLEFAGRQDDQVKIRGRRIELGEVEHALCLLPAVRAAAAVVAPDAQGENRIVAFAEGSDLDAAELLSGLKARLPRAMTPAQLVLLDRLPRSVSGKIDRESLVSRIPSAEPPAVPAPATAAADPLLQVVVDAIASVLGIDPAGIGADDDFFDLGGHSLLVIDLVADLTERLGVAPDLDVVFATPDVRSIVAACLDAGAEPAPGTAEPDLPAPDSAWFPLSPAQRRMWIQEQLEPDQRPVRQLLEAFWLDGPLSEAELSAALTAEAAASSVLRTVFGTVDGTPRQRILPPAPVPVRVFTRLDTDRAAAEEQLGVEAARPFDLATEPPLRAYLVRLADGTLLLGLLLHHIACDGESAAVFTDRLFRRIAAHRTGAPAPEAPDLRFVDHLLADAPDRARRAAADRQYWTGRLTEHPPFPHLPADGARGGSAGPAGLARCELGEADSRDLRSLAARNGTTVFTVVLATAARLLNRLTGLTAVTFGTPVSGRGDPALRGVLGPFLNTVVLRVDLTAETAFPGLVTHCRDVVREAMAHRSLPFDELVEALPGARDGGRTPLFTVMLTMDEAGGAGTAPEFDAGAGLRGRRALIVPGTTEFELSLHADNSGERIGLSIEYDAALFSAGRIDRVLGLWRWLLTDAGAADKASALPEDQLAELAGWAGSLPTPGAIVDEAGRLAPAGVTGQLVELPAERPFGAESGAAGRPTGRRARWSGSGELLPRGHTADVTTDQYGPVDPAEAEAVLAGHPDVAAAAVFGAPGEGLSAVVVPAAGRTVVPQALRNHVRSRLPARLSPARIVVAGPDVLRYGVLDRTSARAAHARAEETAAPAEDTPDAVTSVVADLMAEALGRATFAPHDDFVAAGGGSLAAVAVATGVRARLGTALSPAAVFELRSPAALAPLVRAGWPVSGPGSLPRHPRGTPFPLTADQAAVVANLDRHLDPAAFALLELVDVGPADPATVRGAVRDVFARHDVLHARLAPGPDGSPHWWPTGEPGVVWAGFDDLPPDERQAAALHALVTSDVGEALDLSTGQVARARLIRLGSDRQVLVLVLHHIVADGVASRLLVEQIRAELSGAPDRRPAAASFADWTAFQRDRAATDGFAVELAHWRLRLRGAPGPDPLPPDAPRISAEAVLPELREFRWAAPAGRHARAVAAASGCTPFMVLLGGLVAALRAGGGPAEAWLATTVSQRDRPELAETVGLLSTTAVLRIDLDGEPDSGELLRRVRRELLDAHAMAGAPFPVVAEALRAEGAEPDELARVLVVAQDDLPVAGSADELLREHAVTRPLATAYDLVVSLGVAGDAVDGSVIYKGELFEDATIGAFLRRYEEIVRSWPVDGVR